ncbi:MAG: twin-arginine translocase TatA/TatE family subunit [Saprospiraceae bacterium]|nr:twin-arginine translocase TatA/TatE family subunit [Saprospiraceae bacterium]
MLFSSLLFNLGGSEIILIMLVVLVLFGGKKIPELMRGLGQGIKEFNNAKSNIESEVKENLREIESKK